MENILKKNEIDNKELKEKLANFALGILKKGEDYEELVDVTCTFGYLYVFGGKNLEALFKIIIDKKTFYFAAQGSSLKQLNYNEELFKGTTETFLELNK